VVLRISKLQERPPTEGRGAEGASLEEIRTKLSGKRTVTYLNPGKTEVTSLGHRRGQIPSLSRDNLSGQKTGGRRLSLIRFSSFYFGLSLKKNEKVNGT